MKDYGSAVFALWRHAAGDSWARYTHHAFVEELANGKLPAAAFKHYLIQDYLFLMHFSRAWSLVVVKADTIDEMRHAASTVDALVNQEMQLHIKTCAGYGLSEPQLAQAEEAAANIAYTRYVLDAGYAGDLLDLLAALAPCVFGYGEIGARLKAQVVPDNPYQDWIDTYASADYQQVCETVGGLIDSAVERRLGSSPADSPRWPRLGARFRQATELEVNFWQMGLDGSADA